MPMDERRATSWARAAFSGADLGHAARSGRAVRFAAKMMQSPAASIPTLCGSKSAAKAAYMLLQNEEVTHEALLEAVFEQTAARCASQACGVLAIQDTMTASFGGVEDREGLGPVNDQERTKGFLVHTALALHAGTHEVLGVLDQHVWSRSSDKRPRDESAWHRRKRSRESERWSQMESNVARRLPSNHVIAVFDREGDIFEVFETLDELQHSFVIRATQNRLVAGDVDEVHYSLDHARAAPIVTHRTIEVPARGGGRGARVAHLQIRATRVSVQPPKNRDRQGTAQWMNVVLVEETNPPSKKEALCWFLLTREPIDTAEQVLFVVGCYEARWKIEEFHMGLKTGCSLEARQLTSDHRLKNFLAFATAIACELLKLRDASRRTDLQACDVLTPIQLEILRETHPRITSASTALVTLKAVAELGGFYGSNKDKRPGWRTLWTGFRQIVEKEKGYLLALRKTDPQAWAAAISLTPAHRIGEP
jgi:hypothetical protein